MSKIKTLKDKKKNRWTELPVTNRNKFKKRVRNSEKIQMKYQANNIDTNLKGEKLIFTGSGSFSWEKVWTPTVEEVISGESSVFR